LHLIDVIYMFRYSDGLYPTFEKVGISPDFVLIGLLVAAVKTNKIPNERAIEILNKLAKGDFRVSSDIYIWARAEITKYKK
jgi:hypothetical protein